MAAALSSCSFLSSLPVSTLKFRNSLKHTPLHCNNHSHRVSLFSSSFTKSNLQKEGAVQKKHSKDERPAGGSVLEPQPTSSEPFGIQRKNNKDLIYNKDLIFDSKDQQVEPSLLQDSTFLNTVVKVYSASAVPDYSFPWKKQKWECRDTRSAFMIGDRKLLTNSFCLEHDSLVKVKKRGDDSEYLAKVLARDVDRNIALLSVESEEFWRYMKPLRLGPLPHVQDSVTVVGYPLVGDTISVVEGVVSRIEVSSHAYGPSDFLGIQIDAEIDPGDNGCPAFNDQGECIGLAIKDDEYTAYVIPTTVLSHFLIDYERNGRYTGFPCLGVLIQTLENPALCDWLKVQSNEGVLVRRVEPTSDANNVLKEGDVIVSIDDVPVGSDGTVPFRSNERIAFHFLISQKFAGDTAELGIIRAGTLIKIKVVLNSRVHLVPYNIDEGPPSCLIIAGLVFTPLSESFIVQEDDDCLGLKLLAKARYSLARFKGEQIVILSKVLPNKVNIGYKNMNNLQVVKFNGTRIKTIHHLAHLIDSCEDRYLCFEFEDSYVAVFEKEAVSATSTSILWGYGMPPERSSDLLKPYVETLEGEQPAEDQEFGDCPVSNFEIYHDGLLWT